MSRDHFGLHLEALKSASMPHSLKLPNQVHFFQIRKEREGELKMQQLETRTVAIKKKTGQ